MLSSPSTPVSEHTRTRQRQPAPASSKRLGLLRRIFRSEALRGYLFISPWLLGFLALGLWPLLDTVYNSFTKYNLFNTPVWIGLQNYEAIFLHDPVFAQISLNMAWYVPCSTLISIGGGLALAVLLNRQFVGNHLFRVIIYVPSLLVGVAVGMMFQQAFSAGDAGVINEFLGLFHLGPFNWLSNFKFLGMGIIALILVNCWFVGGTMLIFLAGLKGISKTYYEAASIDGASKWTQFTHITLPLLSPVILFNTIMVVIGHIQVFEVPLTFAAGGSGGLTDVNPLGYHNSLGSFLTYLYVQAFVYNDFGYGSALAVIIFVITLLLTLLILWMFRKFLYYEGESRS